MWAPDFLPFQQAETLLHHQQCVQGALPTGFPVAAPAFYRPLGDAEPDSHCPDGHPGSCGDFFDGSVGCIVYIPKLFDSGLWDRIIGTIAPDVG